MAAKPNEPAKGPKSVLSFIPAGMPRDLSEIFVSGIPGAFVLALFILGTAVLNIIFGSNSPLFAATYLPVVCLLPLVVGIVAPLVLERVRGVDVLSLRRSIAASFLSGMLGSLLGAFLLIISGVAVPSAKPFGSALTGLPTELVLVLVLVFISTVLSAIGGAILVMFLSRAMAPKPEG